MNKDKKTAINQLITASIFIIFMVYLIIRIQSTFFYLCIIPFLLAGISLLLQAIMFLLGKEKLVNFFGKLYNASFFVFWFGFLILFDVITLKQKDFLLFSFSLIFWVVGIILFINNLKQGSKVEVSNEVKSEEKNNSNNQVLNIISWVIFVIGSVILVMGVVKNISLFMKTRNYEVTNAYYDYDESKKNKASYTYDVEGIEYKIKSNYYLPFVNNSDKLVKYNRNNPEDAVIAGLNENIIIMTIGIWVTFAMIAFISSNLQKKDYFKNIKFNIAKLYFGVFIVLAVISLLYAVYGEIILFR